MKVFTVMEMDEKEIRECTKVILDTAATVKEETSISIDEYTEDQFHTTLNQIINFGNTTFDKTVAMNYKVMEDGNYCVSIMIECDNQETEFVLSCAANAVVNISKKEA